MVPVRDRGFDYTIQGAYSIAAGVSYALGLDEERTANVIASIGTAYNARGDGISNLFNLSSVAFPSTGRASTHAAFLTMKRISAPEEPFEGNKVFKQLIAGDFRIDWNKEDLEMVRRTVTKKFNVEIYFQSILEGVQDMVRKYCFDASRIKLIEIETFKVACNIIQSGDGKGRKEIQTKGEANYSLPYLVAMMILDGGMLPVQHFLGHIERADIQKLSQKIKVKELNTLIGFRKKCLVK